jgi:hypothetical protein
MYAPLDLDPKVRKINSLHSKFFDSSFTVIFRRISIFNSQFLAAITNCNLWTGHAYFFTLVSAAPHGYCALIFFDDSYTIFSA